MNQSAAAMPTSARTSEERAFWDAAFWEATESRDSRMDGFFYYAVLSTGVYCRPSCPSRRPMRANVLFFEAREAAESAGFRACLRCKPASPAGPNPKAEMVRRVCRHIERHLDGPLTLGALGRELGVSPFHLQRTFRELLGITPRAYADQCRTGVFKRGLQQGASVTRAMVDAGYGSTSRLYERSASQLGMQPSAYRKGGAGARIAYAVSDSPLGKLIVAATGKGICAIRFGDSARVLEETLRAEFPAAELRRDETGMAAWSKELIRQIASGPAVGELPLDIRATAFQRRVWEHLRTIPPGATQSYSAVARAIGRPKAARAVARACASNPVAVAIPCHRVVREGGALGGYRWGIERKQQLLENEKLRSEA